MEAGGLRSLRYAPPMLLLLLLEMMPQSAAESPWGLPVVPDDPASHHLVANGIASLAKGLMAELSSLKLENKSWPGGTHSLRYHYLALSEPGLGLPHFLALGYVDDQPFIRYDSHVGKAQPQAPWMAPVDTQYWEMETKKHRSWEEVQQVEIWTLMSYYNQSGGTHSTQHMFGCDIQEDGRSSSFWQFGFEGQDHLTLDLETLSWVSAVPMAVRTKHWWESQHCYAEYNKAYLETLCLTSLRRYLELGGQHFTRREAPTVQVTRLLTQDGDAMLRCWALGFYPRDISLSWWLGEEELALETEHVETRPSGDGTYQTWAAVWVPAGEEARYTCHVQHSGLNHMLTVAWGEELGFAVRGQGGSQGPHRESYGGGAPFSLPSLEPPSHHGLIVVVVPLFLLLLVVGGGVVICIKRFPQGPGIRKDSYEQAPGGEETPNSQSSARAGAAPLLC